MGAPALDSAAAQGHGAGAAQWIKYDHDFREWATAKGARKWGELNLPIYGRCLSVQHKVVSTTPIVGTNIGRQKRDRQGKSLNSESKKGSGFKWNFEHTCSRIDYHYTRLLYTTVEKIIW